MRQPELESKSSGQDNIINLSCYDLSIEERSVLSRGLNFCPATGGYSEFQLVKDLHNFERNMRLREYFYDRSSAHNTDSSSLPSYKHWTPPSQRDKCLDLYIRAVQRDVMQAYKERTPLHRNLTDREQQAIESLASRNDIIIKPADKGGAIVVMDRSKYISEGHRQLSDASYYKRQDHDPTNEFKDIVRDTLTALFNDKEMSYGTLKSLIPLSPVAGRFYLLPKIHKRDNPGRPIISGIGTVTENLSRYVDSLINTIPSSFSSYIKDTNHFLSDIVDLQVPQNSFLVTLDVTSLYTNIPHSDGIEAVICAYNDCDANKPVSASTLATLLKLILELNNFEFDGTHYVQVSGTSMGTRIGPNYANIFMGLLENKFLANCEYKPFYYKRFIDDIFLIWHHSESQLLSFIADLNNAHPAISFSHSYSPVNISFLDVMVTLRNGKLITNLYRKPTDRQQYLHFSSSHVKHNKTSIPYSQAVRFKRICSDSSEFSRHCEQLRSALEKQSYPASIITDAIKRAEELDRSDLLSTNKRPKDCSRTNLILTHAASAPNVNHILKKHFNILIQSERLKGIFTEQPRVVYRRSRNLRDLLTSSKTTCSHHEGCHPCNKPRCKVCAHMTTSKTVSSTSSSFSLKINGNYTCDSINVIYLLECSTCGAQYIGQTETSFRIRFNNHRAHAVSLPNLPLSKHVSMPGHGFDKIRATIIQSGFKTNHDREVRESFLIHKFNTIRSGINENVGKLTCLAL